MTPTEDEQPATLEAYMKTLFEAGFDVQTVLTLGYDFALIRFGITIETLDPHENMLSAAQQVLEVAQSLHIDRDIAYRESQFKASRDDMRMRRQ